MYKILYVISMRALILIRILNVENK